MYRAYYISTEYSRFKKRVEIAKGQSLEQCKLAMAITNQAQYIYYLMYVLNLPFFEEQIFITNPSGKIVFTTKEYETEEASIV